MITAAGGRTRRIPLQTLVGRDDSTRTLLVNEIADSGVGESASSSLRTKQPRPSLRPESVQLRPPVVIPPRCLCTLVDCKTCGLTERNRAVWALGQLREARALPILVKYHTRRKCNHASDLCQYELEKAFEAIQRASPVWLGYRDLAKR